MSDIVIYECLYSAQQEPSLAGAHPLYIANHNPERRELQAYVEAYKRQLYSLQGYTGVFSPKFELKCHVTLDDFVHFASQQHAATCHINPFPQIAYWSYNVWEQGEIAHPGLTQAAQQLLDAVGIGLQLAATPRHSGHLLAYSNFWVGNTDFWQRYVGQVLVPISDFLDEYPSHPAAIGVLHDTPHTDPAPFLPFIVERLYSTWISTQPLGIASFPQSAQNIVQGYCNNAFERLLFQQMQAGVDAADANGLFPIELRQRMTHMCQLFQQHFFDYYAHRPHPHSGNAVNAPGISS